METLMEPHLQSVPATSLDFAELYRLHKQAVHSYILARIWDRERSADVLQQTFLALLQARKRGKSINDPLAYLIATARNLCADAVRHKADQPLTTRELTLEQKPDQPALLDNTERAAIAAALQQLPAEQCEVVTLKCFNDMTFDRIAGLLGIPLKTAASRYEYGLQKLRQLLKTL